MIKGRGAQFNPVNRFDKLHLATDHIEGLDELLLGESVSTQFFEEHPKKIVNSVDSPDLPMSFSMNPYQGCEHGCTYCYARPTHEYWGFSSGLDFESKIIIKKNAAQLLEQKLNSRNWQAAPIMLSGNTDCYQPVERRLGLTRELLKTLLTYGNPVGIITKNSLILRDIDLLKQLADEGLVHVMISMTTADESLRRVMEPRTAAVAKKMEVIRKLSEAGIPTGVMIAPVIPGLTDHELPQLMKLAAEAGALTAGYSMVRLNGSVAEVFKNWLYDKLPTKADKVWNQISEVHGGSIADSRFGTRMRGEGPLAMMINRLFQQARKKHFEGKQFPEFNLNALRKKGQGSLF